MNIGLCPGMPGSRNCLLLVALVLRVTQSLAGDILMLPAEPFHFIDGDDPHVLFRSCIVARVQNAALPKAPHRETRNPALVYSLVPIRAVSGRKPEGPLLLYGPYGYARGNCRYESSPGRYEQEGCYSPGDVVCLPLEPDPDMTPEYQEFLARNAGMPKGDYYRIGEDPLPLTRGEPRDVAWSKLFMDGLVRYVELREQASQLEEGRRGRFWLEHIVPAENVYVRMQAIWWLGQLGYEPAIPRIALAFTEGGDDHGRRMRRVAAEALRKFTPQAYVGHLGRLATHTKVEVRREAVSLLAIWVKQDEAASFCERYISDPDEKVRIRVITTAATHSLWDFVERGKSDQSPKVREKAKALLEKRYRAE